MLHNPLELSPSMRQNLGAEAIIFGGYKWLCGAFGASVMYAAQSLQRTLDLGLVGFRSNKNIWNIELDRQVYSDTAHRFEFSTMAYGCAVGLAESVKYLNSIGIENIHNHNFILADKIIYTLEELGAAVFSPKNSAERTSIISARFPNIESNSLVDRLNKKIL